MYVYFYITEQLQHIDYKSKIELFFNKYIQIEIL